MFRSSGQRFAPQHLMVLIVLLFAGSLTTHFSMESMLVDSTSIDGPQACECLDQNEEHQGAPALLVDLDPAAVEAVRQNSFCQFCVARGVAALLPPPKFS